jgi:hypothetical protein
LKEELTDMKIFFLILKYLTLVLLLFPLFNLEIQSKELDSLVQQKLDAKIFDYYKNSSKLNNREKDIDIINYSDITINGNIYVVGIESRESERDTNFMIKFKTVDNEYIIEHVFDNFYKYNINELDSMIIKEINSKTFIEIYFFVQVMTSCKSEHYVLFEDDNNNLNQLFDVKCYESSYSYNDCGPPLNDDKTIVKLYKKYLKESSTEFSSMIDFDKSSKSEYCDIVMKYIIKEFLDEEKIKSYDGVIRYKYSKSKKRYFKQK